jgi:hypothetical protein
MEQSLEAATAEAIAVLRQAGARFGYLHGSRATGRRWQPSSPPPEHAKNAPPYPVILASLEHRPARSRTWPPLMAKHGSRGKIHHRYCETAEQAAHDVSCSRVLLIEDLHVAPVIGGPLAAAFAAASGRGVRSDRSNEKPPAHVMRPAGADLVMARAPAGRDHAALAAAVGELGAYLVRAGMLDVVEDG